MPDLEPIVVFGAGAVGCFFGGLLARAGCRVHLVGRGVHVDAIQRHGLVLELKSGRETVILDAHTSAEAVRGAKLVLVCVKSSDTASAAQQIAPYIDPQAMVMSLQNGVSNAQILQGILRAQVLAVAVYVAVGMDAPGVVRHHGRSELVISDHPQAENIKAIFARAAVPVAVSNDVQGALWAKLIVNCAFNALSAITQLPYGQLFALTDTPEMLRAVVEECRAVAKAEGVMLPGDAWADVESIARSMPTQISSTARDLARGHVSEVDHLNGWIVQRGRHHGIPTPVNQTLLALVHALESRQGGFER
jgi:2-dehydropantoate 2-reductase